ARRPVADPPPHAPQQPAAARRRERGLEARRPPLGLRRQSRKRRSVGRRFKPLVDRGAGGDASLRRLPRRRVRRDRMAPAPTPPSEREGPTKMGSRAFALAAG